MLTPGNGSQSTAGPTAAPATDEVDLKDLWNFAIRNRFIILGGFLLGVLVAAFVTWRAVPVYEAGSSVRIEDDEPFSPLAAVLGPEVPSLSLRVETEMGVLRSRTLAEDVVDSLQLMLRMTRPTGVPRDLVLERIHVERWSTPAAYRLDRVDEGHFAMTTDGPQQVADTVAVGDVVVIPGATFRLTLAAADHDRIDLAVVKFTDAVAAVRSQTSVRRPDRVAAIVEVGYRSPDTLLVDTVPNLIARRYIDRRLQNRQAAATGTVAFLRNQIDSLSVELTRAEDALQAFREGEQVVSLEAEASAQVTQLARLQADRNALDAERGALQQLLDGINQEAVTDPVRRGEPSPYRRLIAFPSLLQNQAASQLLQTLNALENERSDLLRRRTMEDPDVEALTGRIEELEDQLRSIAVTYLQGLTNQVGSLDQTLTRFGAELSRIPAKELQVARLERQSSVLREIYMLLQTRLQEAEIAQAAEDPSVRVLDPAVVNPEPVSPRTNLNLLLGALLGLMLGVAVAGGKDFLDSSIHTREDVEAASGGLPILAVIPRFEGAFPAPNGGRRGRRGRKAPPAPRPKVEPRLITLHSPHDPVTEAYRALRTSIRFARSAEPPKSIVFTSALPQDGKSTTSANLAVTLAQQGTRTLLVDADLRRGVMAAMFRQPAQPGLSNVLVGDATVRDAIRHVEVAKGTFLHVLPAGAFPPNPAELVGSSRMEALLRKLEEHYDAVILDSPPLNLVTDAALLGVGAGGVILVARAAVTDRGAIRYAAEQLHGVGAPVLGAVLNDVDHERDGRYGSGYGAYHAYYRSYYGVQGREAAKV